MELSDLLVGYIVIVNICGFLVMGLDKYKAIRNSWRVPEKTLFLFSLIGGSLGTWAGMYFFRHKTKHWYFEVGMPAILIAQVAIAYFIKINM